MSAGFADRLVAAVRAKRSHVVVGLDPYPELIPPELYGGSPPASADREGWAEVFLDFFLGLLPEIADAAVAVKPQIAFFERLGFPGLRVYEAVVKEAAALGLLVIGDVKRGDIGSTAGAYAEAHLDVLGADAVTVNPYFGTDGLEPFLLRVREKGKGIFVLVRTSNPSAGEVQDVQLASGNTFYAHMAGLVRRWGEGTLGEEGYRSVGAVVGGTGSDQAGIIRSLLPQTPLLIPGYGAQGAKAADLKGLFGVDGRGAVVNSSRGVLYAYRSSGGDWKKAAREEVRDMKRVLWEAAYAE